MIHPREAAIIQEEVAKAFGDRVGVRDEAALHRALGRPFARDNGLPAYPTLFNKVSILLYSLLEARPFEGGNRRTALCIVALVLRENGYTLHCSAEDVKPLLQGVEIGFTSWHRVTAWIKGHTRRERRKS